MGEHSMQVGLLLIQLLGILLPNDNADSTRTCLLLIYFHH